MPCLAVPSCLLVKSWEPVCLLLSFRHATLSCLTVSTPITPHRGEKEAKGEKRQGKQKQKQFKKAKQGPRMIHMMESCSEGRRTYTLDIYTTGNSVLAPKMK